MTAGPLVSVPEGLGPVAAQALLAGGLFVDGREVLEVSAITNTGGGTLGIHARLVTPQGELTHAVYSFIPAASGQLNSDVFKLARGVLTSVFIHQTAGNISQPAVWVRVSLVRRLVSSILASGRLTSGYVYTGHPLAWPPATLHSSLEGPGAIRARQTPDPGAGAQVQHITEANARTLIRSIRFTLVTSAVAGNRNVSIECQVGGLVQFRVPSQSAQAAGLTHNYNVVPGATAQAVVGVEHVIPWPLDYMLPELATIQTAVAGMDAGDNFGAANLVTEEWLEP